MKTPKLDEAYRAKLQTEVDKWKDLGAHEEGSKLDWGDADAQLLLSAVDAATCDGCAVLFGRTSDGGALLVQILNGGGRHKLYPTSVDEANEALQLIVKVARG